MEPEAIQELEERGLLINPSNLEPYLRHFPNYEEEMKRFLAHEPFWKERRVFVTGISGFAGSHLAEKLIKMGAKIYGLVRRHSVPEYRNIAHIVKNIDLVEGNLTDFDSLLTAINEHDPEYIFHLGAQSFVQTSFRCPIETYDTNVIGTANLLEAIRKSKANIKALVMACSSEEYGMVYPNELPIKETNPLRPQSPYAASKVATEMISQVHYKAYGTPVVINRTFNHTGPRRGLQFVSSVVCRQVVRAAMSGNKEIYMGKLDSVRDFTDVRDVAQAYLLAAERARKGEPYNIGHGWGITIENLVKLTAMIAGVDVTIKVDPSRFRPAEVEALICDYSKAKRELGYHPRIPLTKALADNIEYFKANPHLLDIERH